MVNLEVEVNQLFSGTILADRKLAKVQILDSDEYAFALEISSAEVEQCWQCAHKLLPKSGRWPVVSTFWGGGGDTWQEQVEGEEFFSRFFFEEAPNNPDVSPHSLIDSASDRNVDELVEKLVEYRNCDELDEETIEWHLNDPKSQYKSVEEIKEKLAEFRNFDKLIENHLSDTKSRYGIAPSAQEAKTGVRNRDELTAEYRLERWLLEWELQQPGDGKPELAHQEWFTQDPSVLLLLPTAKSWETLAYINWYGASRPGTEYYIPLLKYWSEKYGAKLVAHYGTMLQFFVSEPPVLIQDAWKLACQHDLVAPCTLALPGITVRHHALSLVGNVRWFLHERP